MASARLVTENLRELSLLPHPWFTSSTGFANPAITIGRMFSDTFADIAPSSVPPFIAAQILGGIPAAGIMKALYPAITPADAADIIVPHHGEAGRAPASAARPQRLAVRGRAAARPGVTDRQLDGSLPCTWS